MSNYFNPNPKNNRAKKILFRNLYVDEIEQSADISLALILATIKVTV
jgi:hypothetical protein